MRTIKHFLCGLSFLLLLAACNSTATSREHDVFPGSKPEFAQSRTRGNVKIDVRFRPAAELRTKSLEEDSTQAGFYRYYYFVMSLSVNGKDLESNAVMQNKFAEQIAELSSGMSQHIIGMADGKEKVEIVDYIYPRMYGGTPSTSFMVAFDRARLQHSKEFQVVVSYPAIGILNESFTYSVRELEEALKF